MNHEILTDKQEIFCQNVVAGVNATESARRAGYSKASSTQAHKFLDIEKVVGRIEELRKILNKKAIVKPIEILKFLKSAFETSITEYISITESEPNEDGKIVRTGYIDLADLEKLPKNLTLLINEIAPTPNGFRLKLVDKMAAIQEINKMLGNYAAQKTEGEIKNVNELSSKTDEELQKIIDSE